MLSCKCAMCIISNVFLSSLEFQTSLSRISLICLIFYIYEINEITNKFLLAC